VHYDPAASARIREISMNAAAAPSRDNIRKRLEWLVCDPQRVTDEMVELRLGVYSQAGFSQAMAHIMSLHTPEYRLPNLLTEAEMATVRAPTLVLWTLPGPDNSVVIGEKLASMIPGARLVVMYNCRHWPQLEDSERFNRIHIDFLRS
jgi:2-hydroxy-6-oxonona-2,4-dienedioate hydrolase